MNIEPTQAVCPANKGGGRHHLTPHYVIGTGMVMKCISCHKTQAELTEELADNGS